MNDLIDIDKLTKVFNPGVLSFKKPLRGKPGVKALDNISLSIGKPGEIVRISGPNGSGKSTLLKCLAGALYPTSGHILISGKDIYKNTRESKTTVGLATDQERSFYWRLSGRDNLAFFAGLYGVSGKLLEERIGYFGKVLDIEAWLDKPFSGYSTGIRQRFSILRALLHEPGLLLLDEPYKSLDKASMENLNKIFRDISGAGRVILYTSHESDGSSIISSANIVIRNGKVSR